MFDNNIQIEINNDLNPVNLIIKKSCSTLIHGIKS